MQGKGRAKGFHRVHSGDHRIIFRISDAVLLVCVVEIGNRKDVHRGLESLIDGPDESNHPASCVR